MHRFHVKRLAFIALLTSGMLVAPVSAVAADSTASGADDAAVKDLLERAKALTASANEDLDADKPKVALAKFKDAEALYRKAAGSGDSRDLSNCLNDQAACLDRLEQYSDSLSLYRAALAIEQRLHKNEDNPDVADAIGNVAGGLMNLDRFADALPLYDSAVKMQRRLSKDKDSADLSSSLQDYARCLVKLGRFDDALPHYKSALAMTQRLHDNHDDSDVITAMEGLFDCLINLDRDEDALPLARAHLEMQRRLHDKNDSPEVTESLNQLAACLQHIGNKQLHAGKPDKAAPAFQEAIKQYEKAAGSREIADIGVCLNELGFCLGQLKRNEEALAAYTEALNIRRKLTENKDDADTVVIMDNIAEVLTNLNRAADSLVVREAELKMKKSLTNGQDGADVATTESALAFCLNTLGRYEDALHHFQSVLEMRKRLYKNQDHMDVVESMNNVGKCLDELARSGDALGIYHSALAMTRRIYKDQDSIDLATVINNVGTCMLSLGRNEEALVMLQESLAMRQRLFPSQDSPEVAGTLNDMSNCLKLMGRDAEALKTIQTSCEMLKRINHGEDSDALAIALGNFARNLDSFGRYAEALSYFEEALAMQRRLYKNIDHPDIANAMNNLADCQDHLGRHAEALDIQQAATAMLRRVFKDADHPTLARSLASVATILNNQERFEEALPFYQQSLEMTRRLSKGRDDPEVAIVLTLNGGCLIALDRPADALPDLRAALEMQQRLLGGRDHPVIAWHLSQIGQCLLGMSRRIDAIAAFQLAVDMSRRLSDPAIYRYTARLGDCYLSMGKLPEAEAAYENTIDAFEKARAVLGGDDQDRMKFMESEQGETERFISMSRVQLLMKRPDRAAEFLDRGRGRSLLDVLERAERQSGNGLLTPILARAEKANDVELLNRAKQAAAALTEADQRVRQLTAQINIARTRNDADARDKIEQLQPQLDEACRQYAIVHRVAFNLAGTTTFTEIASAQQMQSLLKPRQHMLMYSITDRDVAIIVVPPAGQSITGLIVYDQEQKENLSGVSLVRLMLGYQQAIIRNGMSATRGVRLVTDNTTTRKSDDMTQTGYELFRRLMPPEIWVQIKDDELVYIIPDASMNGLPLETLIVEPPKGPKAVDCRYLLDQGPALCYGPSAAALIKLCGQKPLPDRKPFAHQAVLLGDPVFQRNARPELPPTSQPSDQSRDGSLAAYGPLSPLPGTRKEVTGIYQVLAGKPYTHQPDDSVVVLLGEDATSDRLSAAAGATKYLHIATHGLARSGKDSIYSSIVLTQPRVTTSGDTGLLTLQDLFDHWGGKLDGTELVVLSACNSQGIDAGKTNAITDEGVFGLPWGFWYAGSPAVVASLWEVQDDSTAKLMQTFYQELSVNSHASKIDAFTAARKKLRRDYAEPFFWAPFIYLGNPK